MRDLINATFCVLRSGCPWRMVPDRFAPQTNGGNLRDSFSTRMSEKGVRRDKAALSSGCKSHPAIRSRRKQSEQSWR